MLTWGGLAAIALFLAWVGVVRETYWGMALPWGDGVDNALSAVEQAARLERAEPAAWIGDNNLWSVNIRGPVTQWVLGVGLFLTDRSPTALLWTIGGVLWLGALGLAGAVGGSRRPWLALCAVVAFMGAPGTLFQQGSTFAAAFAATGVALALAGLRVVEDARVSGGLLLGLGIGVAALARDAVPAVLAPGCLLVALPAVWRSLRARDAAAFLAPTVAVGAAVLVSAGLGRLGVPYDERLSGLQPQGFGLTPAYLPAVLLAAAGLLPWLAGATAARRRDRGLALGLGLAIALGGARHVAAPGGALTHLEGAITSLDLEAVRDFSRLRAFPFQVLAIHGLGPVVAAGGALGLPLLLARRRTGAAWWLGGALGVVAATPLLWTQARYVYPLVPLALAVAFQAMGHLGVLGRVVAGGAALLALFRTAGWLTGWPLEIVPADVGRSNSTNWYESAPGHAGALRARLWGLGWSLAPRRTADPVPDLVRDVAGACDAPPCAVHVVMPGPSVVGRYRAVEPGELELVAALSGQAGRLEDGGGGPLAGEYLVVVGEPEGDAAGMDEVGRYETPGLETMVLLQAR